MKIVFLYSGELLHSEEVENHTFQHLFYRTRHFVVTAVSMVNGISVNGLGEVAMDASQTASNLIGLGKQLIL